MEAKYKVNFGLVMVFLVGLVFFVAAIDFGSASECSGYNPYYIDNACACPYTNNGWLPIPYVSPMPPAKVEICNDGNDNDCDGKIDAADPDCGNTASPYCGDGVVSSKEECDDTNNINGDGCSSTCKVEAGWICVTQSTTSGKPGYSECYDTSIKCCDDDDGDGWTGKSQVSAVFGSCLGYLNGGREKLCSDFSFSGSEGDACDNDANRNPGIAEICNDGIDNDCDGMVDEGCVVSNNPVKVVADKIICDDESTLPNWGWIGGDQFIGPNTAQNYVNSNLGCRFESGWNFQIANSPQGNPGDGVAEAAGWTTFGPTNNNGRTSTEIEIVYLRNIWMREVFVDGYLPFTGAQNDDDVSAEFYCNVDNYKFDNYERVDYPVPGETYYCIGFNVEREPVDNGDCRFNVDFNNYQNWNGGDVSNKIFVGENSGYYNLGEWISLEENDIGLNEDVPGLAIQRESDRLKIFLYGNHSGNSGGKEAIDGFVTIDNGEFTRIENVNGAPYERWGDGVNSFGNAGQDEAYLTSSAVSDFVTTVTTHNDAYYLYYACEGSCVTDIVNGSWSEWENVSGCVGDLISQERSRTEYDANDCGDFGNVTYTETRDIGCLGGNLPPASISDLHTTNIEKHEIDWAWTNPADEDFFLNLIYLDGVNVLNTSDNFYLADGLDEKTYYEITVYTMDNSSNINWTGVSDIARTLGSSSSGGNYYYKWLNYSNDGVGGSLTSFNDSNVVDLSTGEAVRSDFDWSTLWIWLLVGIVSLLLLVAIILILR